ncbi:putative ATPase [Allocatelliglobosispora scoriae]|uniref:Putative ATPase n=1 Tax=Allocatelliglobosispora scoriae TaxID=643052 RepID=A0A841BKC5_9ACTN|nr:DUF3696 domain-containing protein [Allocatelliglobosispora scoriae]MBB5868724.1 putative ATPase [Allocatelliglobosispora scoriae]
MLTGIAFTNFRCFREQQALDLRPVTVVLGKNNSGKSAFTRAPMVFHTGFVESAASRPRAPLDLDRLGHDSVASFTDLVYRHSSHGKVTVDLTFNDRLVKSVSAQVQNIDGERLQVVSKAEIVLSFGTWLLEWLQQRNVYKRTWTDAAGETSMTVGPIDFDGLVPRDLPRSAVPPSEAGNLDLVRACAAAFGRISYLSPFRDRPRREHSLPVGEPDSVGDQGQYLSGILANDQVRRDGRLRRRVNELMREILPDWTLEEEPDGRLFTTSLRSRVDPHLSVNIADAGSGVTQILPMLVQQALDEVTSTHTPTLHIIEEPELHLHPAAHAQLADLYLRAARATGNRFLIETHSEALLLRLRRRIAENESVGPADVGLYFVQHDGREAMARSIAIDESGQLDWWPPGVFTEDFEEVRALAAAQLRRAADDAA